MRVFYRPGTGRPLRVAWTLEEAGVSYEPVRLEPASIDDPEHLARHPLGRVPAVELDGVALFESTALALHIADLHPESGLIGPLGSPERARVYQWSIAAMTELERAVSDVFRHRADHPEWAAAAATRFREVAVAFQSALGDREFFVGDHLTVADIVVGGVVGLGAYAKLLDGLPGLEAYVGRLAARPAFQRASVAVEALRPPA